jgi:hypothetical protein
LLLSERDVDTRLARFPETWSFFCDRLDEVSHASLGGVRPRCDRHGPRPVSPGCFGEWRPSAGDGRCVEAPADAAVGKPLILGSCGDSAQQISRL